MSVWFLFGNAFNPQFNNTSSLVSDYSGPDAEAQGDLTFFAELDFQDFAQFTNQLVLSGQSLGTPHQTSSPAVVNDNHWHNCTSVLDGQGTASMYVDGALSSQSTYNASLNYLSQPFWRIGADQFGGQMWNVFNGLIDDVRIYNVAFSSNQVQQLYQYESAPQVGLVEAVIPTFSNLHLGTNYQLEVSTSLSGTFTNYGSPFTATNSTMIYPQYFNVANWNQFFFRLVAP